MVDRGGHLDSKPFGKLSVLYAEIRNRLLDPDFLKEFGETISFDDIPPEPGVKVSS